MSYFLHDYLEVFSPHAVPRLVSPACMARIEQAARPLSTVDGGGFECKLGDDSTHADFAVRLSQRDLSGLPPLHTVADSQREVWTRVHELAAAWQRNGSRIGAGATKLWLEYDIDDSEQSPAPSVFVGLGKSSEAARACVRESLALLLDADRCEAAQAWVQRCFDALPGSARIAFLGVLLPRAGAAINLNFIALPSDGIAPLLAAVGWPGDINEVAALAAELGRYCDRLALSLSFGDEVLARIGLECFVDQPNAQPVWASMLDHFVDTGLCTPAKRDAALGWAGISLVDASRPDDSNLAKVVALLGDQVVAAFTRRVNHLKLSLTPGRRPDLKAYFDFGHVIRRREQAVGVGDRGAYVERVRDYYDSFARSIVETVGTTYQAGMVTCEGQSYRASNVELATRAGVRPGMAVLDAGCGSCGPSVDIAETFAVSIDAITISREQASIGRALVHAHDLDARVRVHVGDYHSLPFAERSFDLVLCFETLGYAYDLPRLFAGVHRVLRPGGAIYIKDTFVREGQLSASQQHELDAHDARYVYRTPRMQELVEALARAGFELELARPLTQISTREYDAAVASHADGDAATAFARHHHHQVRAPLPIYFGELRARKLEVEHG